MNPEKQIQGWKRIIQEEKDKMTGVLYLGNCGLRKIPDEVFDMYWLEELTMSDCNEHREWDPEIITLAPNYIDSIPENIQNLTNLKSLVIAGNNKVLWGIRDLQNLQKLNSLTQLNAAFNLIEKTEGLPKNLTSLNLAGNQILELEKLPSKIISLQLWGNQINKLNNLPTNLKDLNLSSNEIETIEKLPEKLETLHIFNNQISKIKNLPAHLSFLNISNNQVSKIENLPATIKELKIANNQISILEAIPKSITYLDLDDNQISVIENLPPELTYLSLQRNNIRNISNLTNKLVTLILSSNKLSILDNLPDQLRELHITYNRITLINNLPPELEDLEISFTEIDHINNLPSQLKSLNASNNNLKEIPVLPESLKKLELGDNQIEEIENLPPGLQYLDLNSNSISRLQNIPVGLTHLVLNDNKISKLEGLPNTLTNLQISNNQIRVLDELPIGLEKLLVNNNQIEQIFPLPHGLNHLEINNNHINKIVDSIKISSSLRSLHIENNELESVENLPFGLQNLYLSNNHIKTLKKFPASLKKLKLSKNYISIINNHVFEDCVNLLSLDLSNNYLSELENLPINLQQLKIWNNQITTVNKLPFNLRELTIGGNQISILKNLPQQIHNLEIGSNQLTELPELPSNLLFLSIWSNPIQHIENLPDGLQSLEASNCEITQISKLPHSINQLNLSRNKIKEIQFLYNFIRRKYFEIQLDENQISGLSLGSGDDQWNSIRSFLLRQNEASIELTLPVKIVFLGNHGSGKSRLLDYLTGYRNDKKTKSTHILNIRNFSFLNLEPNVLPDVVFYDFGGQDYYHGLYRIFLSPGSLKVLCWQQKTNQNRQRRDVRNMGIQDYNVSYWLGQNKSIADGLDMENPKTFYLVQSHIDKDDIVYLPESEIFKSHIIQMFNLFLGNYENIDSDKKYLKSIYSFGKTFFKKTVLSYIRSEKQRRIFKETKWYIDFLKYIYSQKRKRSSHKTISLDSLLLHYKSQKGSTKKNLIGDLKSLHNAGIVLYYTDKDLANYVWLDPAGLVKYLHSKILKIDFFKSKKGEIDETDIHKLEIEDHILRLLLLQKIFFLKADKSMGTKYIIPNYLPLAKFDDPNYDLLSFGFLNASFNIKFEHYLPFGLINELICFFGKRSHTAKFWRDQIIFMLVEGVRVKIILNYAQLEINVFHQIIENKLKSDDIDEYIFKVIMSMYKGEIPFEYTELQNLHYEDSSVSESISTKEQNWRSLENKDYYPDDVYLSRGGQWFVSISGLFDTIESETITGFKMESQTNGTPNKNLQYSSNSTSLLRHQFNAFVKSKNKPPKKVFISYSKHDIQYRIELTQHLSILERLGKIEIWHDAQIETGEWDAQIQSSLEQADIIIFLISQNFFASQYIWEREIGPSLEKIKNGSNYLLPILVRDCVWEGLNPSELKKNMKTKSMNTWDVGEISNLQFLPYYEYENNEGKIIDKKLKPVADPIWLGKEPLKQLAEILKKITE